MRRGSTFFYLLLFDLCGFLVISGVEGTRCSARQNTPRTIVDVSIEIRGSADAKTDFKDIAEALILVKKGDPFSPRFLEESIDALKRSNRFRDIFVDSKDLESGVSLLFSLTPFHLIENIEITGTFPLLEREVLNEMSLYVSDPFIPEELGRQPALITALFRREGFIAPKVSVSADQDPKNGNYTVRMRIDKGDYYQMKELLFEGNRAFTSQRLKWTMKSWRDSYKIGSSRRFVDRQFTRDIESLVDFYRKKGFADAAVAYEVNRDADRGSVFARVLIDEGALYKVVIEGNKKIEKRSLKKDIVLYEEGNRYEQGLKKSLKKMEERYMSEGFQGASVGLESRVEPEDGKTVRSITFAVREGPKSTVRSLRITGNKTLGDRQITRLMQTRPRGVFRPGGYAETRLQKDIVAIEALYRANGFLDSRVSRELFTNDDSSEVTVELKIEENTRPIVSEVRITGSTSLREKEAYAAVAMRAGKPFRAYVLKADENALSTLIAEKGYPHAKVKGDFFLNENGTSARVEYVIDEGVPVTTGETYFKGNFRTKEKVLRRELKLKPGDPFSPSRMLKEQQNLRNMGIFDSVRFVPIGLTEQREKVHLFVEMVERKPYYLELSGGYDTEQGLYAHTKAGGLNLFGRNMSGWVGVDVSQTGYRAETGILEPKLFGLSVSANLTAFLERKTEPFQVFGTQTLGAALGFSMNSLRPLSSGLTLSFERRYQFTVDSAPAAPGETLPRSIFTASPVVVYDSRDSFLYPKKGVYSLFTVDLSKGIENSFDDFLKFETVQRVYFTPLKPLTFAFVARAGNIVPYGPRGTVPKDQQFFLGGTANVRGFRNNLLFFDAEGNPVGGEAAVSGSIESRLDLGRNFEISFFYDTGCLGDGFEDIALSRFRSSAGAGLRYRTPIGPIGVLYGVNLAPREGESPGVLHFSIGYTF
jgi:outer membrane protein insertion porin family